jgi:hypothetical protein
MTRGWDRAVQIEDLRSWATTTKSPPRSDATESTLMSPTGDETLGQRRGNGAYRADSSIDMRSS